jgi:hypothetical protein
MKKNFRYHFDESTVPYDYETCELRHMDELKSVLEELHIPKNKVVVVGSAALTLCGLRSNGDLDIVVADDEIKKIPFQARIRLKVVGHCHYTTNIHFAKGERYWRLGISKKDLFDDMWHVEQDGILFARPELEYTIKCFMRNVVKDPIFVKDRKDIKQMTMNPELNAKLDWDMIFQLITYAGEMPKEAIHLYLFLGLIRAPYVFLRAKTPVGKILKPIVLKTRNVRKNENIK